VGKDWRDGKGMGDGSRVLVEDHETSVVGHLEPVGNGGRRDQDFVWGLMRCRDRDRTQAKSRPKMLEGNRTLVGIRQAGVARQGARDSLVWGDGEDHKGCVRAGGRYRCGDGDTHLGSATLLLLVDEPLMRTECLPQDKPNEDGEDGDSHRNLEGASIAWSISCHEVLR